MILSLKILLGEVSFNIWKKLDWKLHTGGWVDHFDDSVGLVVEVAADVIQESGCY